MGQKEAEQWAATVDVQPTISKSDRPLAAARFLSSSGVAPDTMIVKDTL
jgi:hypothetical protein